MIGAWNVVWSNEARTRHMFRKTDSLVRMRMSKCNSKGNDCQGSEGVVVPSNYQEFPSVEGWFQVKLFDMNGDLVLLKREGEQLRLSWWNRPHNDETSQRHTGEGTQG